MTDGTDVVAESVLLPSGGTALGGEPGERRCRRPGCGNLVPVSGRGRTRVFCGDACSRRFHNAARSAGGDGAAVPPGQAADPLGALEALIRQAGSLVALARGQVAALDPEVVAAQLAEAEAARRRAEARAVTAAARAAEAELARARQAETDARDQARHTRDDVARERETLAAQYQARLEAAGQLAAAERARALRAEQRLDAERERHDSLLAALTAPGGKGTQPAAGGPGGPAGPPAAGC